MKVGEEGARVGEANSVKAVLGKHSWGQNWNEKGALWLQRTHAAGEGAASGRVEASISLEYSDMPL